jgi:hypothetical protein
VLTLRVLLHSVTWRRIDEADRRRFNYAGGTLLFRGDNLGGAAGAPNTRLVLSSNPVFVGGIVPGAVADASSTGMGTSLALYDTSTDADGVIGVRPLKPADYSSGAEIRNPANGGTTPVNAHFRATGPTIQGGTVNRISTLQMSNGEFGYTQCGPVLVPRSFTSVRRCWSNASFTGGSVGFAGDSAQIITVGNLSLGSKVAAAGISKSGSGTLTLTGQGKLLGNVTQTAGTINVTGPKHCSRLD